MICGVGLSLVELPPIEAWCRGEGGGYEGSFSEAERIYCAGKRRSAEHFGGRLAAKYALCKAVGLDPGEVGDLRAIELVRAPSGRPDLVLNDVVQDLLSRVGAARVHVSISHSGGLAAAMVVLEGSGP